MKTEDVIYRKLHNDYWKALLGKIPTYVPSSSMKHISGPPREARPSRPRSAVTALYLQMQTIILDSFESKIFMILECIIFFRNRYQKAKIKTSKA